VVSIENAVVGLLNYADLQTQFDHVWDGYNRVWAHERIKVRAEIPDSTDADEFVMFHSNYNDRNTLSEIVRWGMIPCTFDELLVYAKRFPDKQRKHLIVALGEVLVIGYGRYAPYLTRVGFGNGRGLDAHCLSDGWDDRYRFLARRVCK